MLVSGLRGRRAACFTEGTQVVVGFDETGQAITTNIEDLRKGDLVVSRDEQDPNAELELREVQAVFVRRVYDLQVISITDNETGETQQINTTGEHPFWVDGQGWTRADELQLGDQVQNPDGTWAMVTSHLVQVHSAGITVYNLEVASGHTYFVADGVGAENGVWVHNTCAGDHHLAMRALGGFTPYRHWSLTYLNAFRHTKVHKRLNAFLKSQTKIVGGKTVHMRPGRGNSGAVVRKNFTPSEREAALRKFYTDYNGGEYLTDFEAELKIAKANGWWK